MKFLLLITFLSLSAQAQSNLQVGARLPKGTVVKGTKLWCWVFPADSKLSPDCTKDSEDHCNDVRYFRKLWIGDKEGIAA